MSHNMFRHNCEVTGCSMFLAGCARRIQRMREKSDKSMWPECADALTYGTCPATRMFDEEAANFAPIYYLDRDDCGPGIVKRRELGVPERTAEEVAEHHRMLTALGLRPYMAPIVTDRQQRILDERAAPQPETIRLTPKQAERFVEVLADPPAPSPAMKATAAAYKDGFSLGDMINDAIQEARDARA